MSDQVFEVNPGLNKKLSAIKKDYKFGVTFEETPTLRVFDDKGNVVPEIDCALAEDDVEVSSKNNKLVTDLTGSLASAVEALEIIIASK